MSGGERAASRAGSTAAADPIIELRGLTKSFTKGEQSIVVLAELDLTIQQGSFECLMGPSGSGKTTLLNLIAGLDRPTRGTVTVAGQELTSLSERQLTKFRARTMGFIFQAYNLLPVLTALENVELPLLLCNLSRAERRRRAQTALRVVGLENRLNHYPRQLSGGQEQRVAIARAIAHDPKIIVADEPTGDLDRENADHVLNLLEKLNKELGKTILMVTHDPLAADRASVQRRLDKGSLVES